MLLKDLCTMDPCACALNSTVMEAAGLMRSNHVGDLVVIANHDDMTPVGIVTDRDIVLQVMAAGLDPSKVSVGAIMRKQLVIASTAESIDQGLRRMRDFGVRRLPIVDEAGKLFGVVTLDDILRYHTTQGALLSELIAAEQGQEARMRRKAS